jgi:hypothetical protein
MIGGNYIKKRLSCEGKAWGDLVAVAAAPQRPRLNRVPRPCLRAFRGDRAGVLILNRAGSSLPRPSEPKLPIFAAPTKLGTIDLAALLIFPQPPCDI